MKFACADPPWYRLAKTFALIVALASGSSPLRAAPTGTPNRPAPPATGRAAPATGKKSDNRFNIWEFRVLGNHVLPTRAIEAAVYPFLGPNGTLDTVKRAADALEKAYKTAGYGTVYVDIPEQAVDQGIVRLKVTEGRIDRVHVRGDRYFSDRQIRAALPALARGKTLALPALQQQLTKLNTRTADRTVAPILKAGPRPGTLDVDLAVKDRLPLHGSVQYDNRHTADTTPNRATVALHYDNLWQRQDSLALEYQTAPAKPRDAEVLVANYTGHLGSSDALGIFSYIRTNSDVVALGTLGVLGKGTIYGAHYLLPIANDPRTSQTFNAGVDYKDVLTSVLPEATAGGTGSSTTIAPTAVTAVVRYLNWSAAYFALWRAAGGSVALNAGVNVGIRSLVNSSNEFENVRYNARPNYFDLRVGLNANQPLPFRFALAARVSGQWADAPLVNNEQFSIGGEDTVRGYLEAETLGDSGAAGSLELHGPSLGTHFGATLAGLYPFAFIDAGVATLIDPLPGQSRNLALWSDGVGLRLDNPSGFAGSVDYAVPRRAGIRTRRDDSRIDFSLQYAF